MKKLLLLYTIVFSVNLVVVMSMVKLVEANPVEQEEYYAYYSFSGLDKFQKQSPDLDASIIQYAGGEDVVIEDQGNVFQPFTAIYTSNQDFASKDIPKGDERLALYLDFDISAVKVDSDMIYNNAFRELPLYPSDYYSGKYTNAIAGVRQLNRMPIMRPGQRTAVIGDKYIVITSQNGYITPTHYVYGSGVCWTTSVLGAMLDDANAAFRKKYGMDLVLYGSGDRAPHGAKYLTYTNNNHGYTILQRGIGIAVQDYRFTINPQIKNIPGMEDFKMKIVMVGTTKHPKASHGESVGAYIISNKEF